MILVKFLFVLLLHTSVPIFTIISASVGDIQSNFGTEFFVAFSKNEWQQEVLKLLIFTAHSNTVSFVATSPSQSFSFVGNVQNGTVVELPIPSSLELQGSLDREKGIWVRSSNMNDEFSVVVLKSGNLVSGGYLALPPHNYTGLQQYTYYGVTYPGDGRLQWDVKSGILIVSGSDNTVITITPSQRISIPPDLRSSINYQSAINVGESYTITMQHLQTLLFESSQDLTGTKVTANKPISIVSSHECVNIPMFVPFCDHIVEQVPPTVTWGRYFLVTSLHTRTTGERYRIVASRASTSVLIHCIQSDFILPETNTTSLFYNLAGQTREIAIGPNRYCSIQATKPILVVQFSLGYSIDEIGDPFMLYVPPVEQFTNNVTVYALSAFQNHISVVVSVEFFNAEQIFVQGVLIPPQTWSPIYCSQNYICGYGAVLGITAGINYVYHSDSNATIGVFSYGFDYHSAYGYPAGTALKQIAELCTHGNTRLVPIISSQPLGRVEVCLNGAWSSICGSNWDAFDATVFCRQLGYTSSSISAFSNNPNISGVPFLFTNCQCTGSESRVIDCFYAGGINDCVGGQVAYAQCEALRAPTMSISVEGVVQLRNTIMIICEAQLYFDIWSGQVQVFWTKDSEAILSSNELAVGTMFQLNGTNTYSSNISLNSITEDDGGVYICQVSVFHPLAGNHSITPVGIAATYISVQPLTSQLIQLRLIGVGDCSVWLYQISNPMDKIVKLTNTLIEGANGLCSTGNCGLMSDNFIDSSFQCFSQNDHKVTFRTTLLETEEFSIMELINAILQWIDSGAVASLSGVLLTIDPQCDIILESIADPECTSNGTPSTVITTVSTPEGRGSHSTSGPEPEDSPSNPGQTINMVAIIAGTVVIICFLIFAFLIGVITATCLHFKKKGLRQSSYLPREVVSVVSPFPPPTYSTAVGKQSMDDKEEKLDYSELDEYWNNSAEHTNTTL